MPITYTWLALCVFKKQIFPAYLSCLPSYKQSHLGLFVKTHSLGFLYAHQGLCACEKGYTMDGETSSKIYSWFKSTWYIRWSFWGQAKNSYMFFFCQCSPPPQVSDPPYSTVPCIIPIPVGRGFHCIINRYFLLGTCLLTTYAPINVMPHYPLYRL